MSRRGLSLFELLLAILIIAVAMGAVTRAYMAGIGFERRYGKAVESQRVRMQFEDRMTALLRGAELGGVTSYFVAPIPATTDGRRNAPGVVFTTWSDTTPSRYLAAKGLEFEDLNTRFGAQGGATEIAVSTDPVGDAGRKVGVFLREQRPPDSDVTQGGEESVLSETVRDIRFEFYDGADWLTTWDSRDSQKDQLPSCVRITYMVEGETSARSFLVRLPLSQAKRSSQS